MMTFNLNLIILQLIIQLGYFKWDRENQIKALIILDHDPDSKYKIVGERLQAISVAKNRFLNAANCHSDWERKDLERKIFVAPANAIFPFINPLRENTSPTSGIRIARRSVVQDELR